MAWIEGGDPAEYPLMLAWDGALYIVYYLALMHHLNGVAEGALKTFRPLLQMDEDTVARARYELTTLPARTIWIGGGVGVLSYRGWPGLFTDRTPHRRDLWHISAQVSFSASNFILGIFIYHTLRQLHMVNRIHVTATRINLYRRDPVYAFSQLTARQTGIGWMLGLSLGLISPHWPCPHAGGRPVDRRCAATAGATALHPAPDERPSSAG